MQDATQHIVTGNGTNGWTTRKWNGRLLVEPLMRTSRVVIVDIFSEHTSQVGLVDDQKAVQTLLAHRTNPALGKRVRIRCLIGRQDRLDTFCGKYRFKGSCELGVPIMDEESDRRLPVLKLPEYLAGLLGYPASYTRRVLSSMKNSTYTVCKKAVSIVKKSQASSWVR
jgi:hypothetical protein